MTQNKNRSRAGAGCLLRAGHQPAPPWPEPWTEAAPEVVDWLGTTMLDAETPGEPAPGG